ncbi:DUF302 domain-containing protein [Arthrobacter sp. UYEF20]|uniref:DUF302 domain-containing protein n=1 Tax=Arthrobacter sp. UYEF20 TaxID=1756363 RepID=UPI003398CE34
MPCGDSRPVRIPPNQAAAQTRAAPAREEPGILTEIDIQAALAAQPGDEAAAQVGDYLIRAVCNPTLARRPITADPCTRPLPPCNVAIRRGTRSRHTAVEAIGPRGAVQPSTGPEMAGIADDSGLRVAPASSTADAPR